jgi:hypothetical protein
MARRTVPVVLGIVALVVGGVWVGQGLNLIPGSFMTGNRMWFWIGLALVLLGLGLLLAGLRRGSGPRD